MLDSPSPTQLGLIHPKIWGKSGLSNPSESPAVPCRKLGLSRRAWQRERIQQKPQMEAKAESEGAEMRFMEKKESI